jgi:hypothetical protein
VNFLNELTIHAIKGYPPVHVILAKGRVELTQLCGREAVEVGGFKVHVTSPWLLGSKPALRLTWS